MKKMLKFFVKKYGAIIAGCAFSFVVFGTNIPCMWPFYEPKEPKGLERFKKHAE
ncbi:MAG: cyclic lactone autoinducer peptide [bacterium]|nr:cyclic lactone autoinducer peptide [bacterium]